MTFHPSGLRECPTRRPSVRKREKVRTKVICFTLLSVFFIFYFLCRRGSRQRRGDTEEEDLMCVCQTICQIQLFFFSLGLTQVHPPLAPPRSRSKGCDSESRSVCWGNYTYMGCLRTEFVLCFGIESHSLYSNLSRISPKWNNVALVRPRFDLCKKYGFQNKNLRFK